VRSRLARYRQPERLLLKHSPLAPWKALRRAPQSPHRVRQIPDFSLDRAPAA